MAVPIPPQPKEKPTDDIPYPQKRRVIWEHGMDMALAFKRLSVVTIALALALLAETGVLMSIYMRPPVVLDQNAGYLMWRTTEAFKLSPDMIETYLNATLKFLYTVNPGNYDLSPIASLVDKRVIAAFGSGTNQDLIVSSNQRRAYELREVRRYHDPHAPQYLALAVRGERVLYEFDPAAAQPFRMESPVVTQVIYLQRLLPTPSNPWGLKIIGLITLSDAKVDEVWSAAIPLGADKSPPPSSPASQ